MFGSKGLICGFDDNNQYLITNKVLTLKAHDPVPIPFRLFPGRSAVLLVQVVLEKIGKLVDFKKQTLSVTQR